MKKRPFLLSHVFTLLYYCGLILILVFFSMIPSARTSLAGPGIELIGLAISFPASAILFGVSIYYFQRKVTGIRTAIIFHSIWTFIGLSLALYIAFL